MRVQILGSGCKKCSDLYDRAEEALGRLPGGGHTLEKVDDVDVFISLGVMVTPALVLDGAVVSAGRQLSTEEILDLMKERVSHDA